jgi:hypothetical protein
MDSQKQQIRIKSATHPECQRGWKLGVDPEGVRL